MTRSTVSLFKSGQARRFQPERVAQTLYTCPGADTVVLDLPPMAVAAIPGITQGQDAPQVSALGPGPGLRVNMA
jgi:hypothetical protein